MRMTRDAAEYKCDSKLIFKRSGFCQMGKVQHSNQMAEIEQIVEKRNEIQTEMISVSSAFL